MSKARHLRGKVPQDVMDKVVAQEKIISMKKKKITEIDLRSEAMTVLIRNSSIVL